MPFLKLECIVFPKIFVDNKVGDDLTRRHVRVRGCVRVRVVL